MNSRLTHDASAPSGCVHDASAPSGCVVYDDDERGRFPVDLSRPNMYVQPTTIPDGYIVRTVPASGLDANLGIPGLDELAERLSVEPGEDGYLLEAESGKKFSLVSLMQALLDRIDQAEQRTRKPDLPSAPQRYRIRALKSNYQVVDEQLLRFTDLGDVVIVRMRNPTKEFLAYLAEKLGKQVIVIRSSDIEFIELVSDSE